MQGLFLVHDRTNTVKLEDGPDLNLFGGHQAVFHEPDDMGAEVLPDGDFCVEPLLLTKHAPPTVESRKGSGEVVRLSAERDAVTYFAKFGRHIESLAPFEHATTTLHQPAVRCYVGAFPRLRGCRLRSGTSSNIACPGRTPET